MNHEPLLLLHGQRPSGRMNHEPLLLLHGQRLLCRLVGRKMHGGEGRVHHNGGLIAGVKRTDTLLLGHAPHAVAHSFVGAPIELQSLLHHVHGGQHRIAGHRRHHPCSGVRCRAVRTQRLLARLVHREVHRVGRAGP
uniref:Uncharacterized protein n=1 Tax=Opuntia streptacantha TaxID=393608 RepID=A0A7C9FAE9_OPUST